MKKMYIRSTLDGKEKYEITINQEKLEELRKRVAKNCGELALVHKECKLCYVPDNNYFTYSDKEPIHYYEDVHYRKSGNKTTEWDHYDEYEVDLYYCDYKDYTCPSLVNYINRLLYADKKAIEMLFSGDISSLMQHLTVKDKIAIIQREIANLKRKYKTNRNKKTSQINERYNSLSSQTTNLTDKIDEIHSYIEKVKEELREMDDSYEKELKELTARLNYLQSILELNEHQEDVSKYVIEMLSYIEYRLVDTISKEELQRYNDFFNENKKRLPDNPEEKFLIKKK